MQTEVKDKPRYAIVAAVQLPSVTDLEFGSLVRDLQPLDVVVKTFVQKRMGFDNA
jgi:GTP-binding protein HflX